MDEISTSKTSLNYLQLRRIREAVEKFNWAHGNEQYHYIDHAIKLHTFRDFDGQCLAVVIPEKKGTTIEGERSWSIIVELVKVILIRRMMEPMIYKFPILMMDFELSKHNRIEEYIEERCTPGSYLEKEHGMPYKGRGLLRMDVIKVGNNTYILMKHGWEVI